MTLMAGGTDSKTTPTVTGAHARLGLVFGALGMLGFSMTLPATRIAVPDLGGTIVGLGRAEVAATLAAILLLALRERPPARRHWSGLAVVALGVVVGFPLLSALALQTLPASHGAVVIGLIPAATAIMAVLRAGERPPPLFWIGCGTGVLAVLVFAITQGAGRPQVGDLLLLAAVFAAALGYAEGGRIARELGSWRVICWALILAAPFLVLPVALMIRQRGLTASPIAWAGFTYVAVVSMFLAFFAWYHGLALGGVARVGQMQLVQPVLTLVWAALLLGERITLPMIGAAALVIGSAALSLWTRGSQRAPKAKPV
jgi:drug/metabolite transporter (DMT)-like permease